MNLGHRTVFFKRMTILVLFCMVSFFVPLAGMDAYAQTQGKITIIAHAGLDNLCKTGAWLPVKVTVENTGTDVEARVQAAYKNDMSGNTVYGVDISLPATSRKEFFIYVFPDGSMRNFTVSVLDGKKVLAKTNLNLNCMFDQEQFYGVVADTPSTFTILNGVAPLISQVQTAQLNIADLPDQEQGWEAMDVLVISNMDTGMLSAEQKQAMKLWLAKGGKLFVTGGIHWQATAAGLDGILPIKLTSTKNVAGLSALATYAKDSTLAEQEVVLATGEVAEGASVLVEQNGIPLLVEKQIGFGKVYFLAADPGMQPLSGWGGMYSIYEHLLSFKSPRPIWADGYWDSYQVNDALSALPELALPSFFYICCWLGLYVFAIGPVNYFVLRRLKRPELAWITIPVMVILFTGLAYLSGYAYRGTRPILNRLMLAQGWEGVDQTQVSAVVGVYSPSRTSYTVETQEQFMLRPMQGTGGDLQGNNSWLSLKNQTGTTLPDMRVDIGGMQTVGANGFMPALTFQNDLTLTLGNHIPTITGTIENTGSYTIQDAFLVTPSGWNSLGDLKPNESIKVDFTLVNNATTTSTSQYSIISTLGMDPYLYSNNEPDQRRRASFFQANTTTSNSTIYVNSGFYIMGWVDQISTPAGLQDQRQEAIDTMLFFEKLTPNIKTEPGQLILTSSIYSWESSLGDTITTPYYNMTNNGYTMRFQPSQTVRFREVESLMLNIESTVTPDKVQASLWNFENRTWDLIPLVYISTDVPDAWQYVGMDGEIRLNIKGDPNDYIEITAVNFTIVVNP